MKLWYGSCRGDRHVLAVYGWISYVPELRLGKYQNVRVKLSSKFQASSTCGRLQRLTSYFPQIVYTTMPFDPIRDIQDTVDLTEQPRRTHGAISQTPNQSSQPRDFVQQTIDEAIRNETSTEGELNDQPRPHRWRPNSPVSSGSEDNVGRIRRNRIKKAEKKVLALLAANICQTELQRRGKDTFWKTLVRKRVEEGGPERNWNSVKSFFNREIAERKQEIDEDDTSGPEIRHSNYYSHIDILIERINITSAPLERTQQAQRQMAAKEATRANLIRSLSRKRRASEAVLDDDINTTSTPGVSETVENNGSERGSISSYSSQKGRRHALIMSRSMDNLAAATLDSAKELAAAIREPRAFAAALTAEAVTRTELYEIINRMRNETGERFIAMEKKQDEYQGEVLTILRSLAGRGVKEGEREQEEGEAHDI